MLKRKLMLLIVPLLILIGCSLKQTDTNVIGFHALIETAPIIDRLKSSDIILYVEILDDLTTDNSVLTKNNEGLLEDIYSFRKAVVLEQISGKDFVNGEIFLTEAVAIDSENKYESYEDGYNSRLEKGLVYAVVVEKMELLGETFYGIKGAGQEKEEADYFANIAELNKLKFIVRHAYKSVTNKQLDSLKYEGILNYLYQSERIDDHLVSYTYNKDDNITYIILNDMWYSIPGKIK